MSPHSLCMHKHKHKLGCARGEVVVQLEKSERGSGMVEGPSWLFGWRRPSRRGKKRRGRGPGQGDGCR